MLPLPPASRVPPRTTAAIDIRSYWPWLPIVGLPTLSRASSSSPAIAASIEQSTCAVIDRHRGADAGEPGHLGVAAHGVEVVAHAGTPQQDDRQQRRSPA